MKRIAIITKKRAHLSSDDALSVFLDWEYLRYPLPEAIA